MFNSDRFIKMLVMSMLGGKVKKIIEFSWGEGNVFILNPFLDNFQLTTKNFL